MKSIITITILISLFPVLISAQVDFSDPVTICESFSPRVPTCVFAVDIDNDDDMDLLTNNEDGYIDGLTILYENKNNIEIFTAKHIIEGVVGNIGLSVSAFDIDNDGDLDVLATYGSEPGVVWFENLNGKNSFSSKHIISDSLTHPNCIRAVDIDKDNDNDVFISSYFGEIFLFENTNGTGAFSEPKSINNNEPGYCEYFDLCDLDNDSDLDLVLFASGKVVWYENIDGLGSFDQEKIITNSLNYINTGFITDFDKDGDMDIIVGAYGKIGWFKNNNGNFSNLKTISNSTGNVRAIYAADMDNDDDVDLLAASSDGNLVWFQNKDAQCNFTTAKIIDEANNSYTSILACDFDVDGDLDVITSYQVNGGFSGKIIMHKNLLNPTFVQTNQTKYPNNVQLKQNYPNPFNPSTTIEYNLQKSNYVTLKIYNLSGQEIETLINGYQAIGEHEVIWQPKGLSIGIYFYKLQAGEFSETKKLILQK